MIDLNQFSGKILYVVTINNGILRHRQCAYYIAESEEKALEFFKSIEKDLPANSEFGTVKFNIVNPTYFNLLFNNNYPGFEMIGYGFVESDQLFTKSQANAEMIRDIYKTGTLYYPLREDGKGIAMDIGDKHAVQSFYTDKDEASKFGKVKEIKSIDWMADLPFDTTLFAVNDKIISGWEMCEGVISAWHYNLMTSDEIKKFINGNELHVLKDDSGNILGNHDYIVFFTSAEAVKKFIADTDNETIKKDHDVILDKPETFIPTIVQDRYCILYDGNEFKYCFVMDLYSYVVDKDFYLRDIMKKVQDVASMSTLYVLLSRREEVYHQPMVGQVAEDKTSILIFLDKDKAQKYIDECNVNADVGILQKDVLGKDLKTMALIAYHKGISIFEICYEAPINAEAAKNNISVPVHEWLTFSDIFNKTISTISPANVPFRLTFNKLDVVS